MGRIYRGFDPQSPETTIPRQLESWMGERRICFVANTLSVTPNQLMKPDRLERCDLSRTLRSGSDLDKL